ncbi:MAG: hypothetical protein Q8865_04935 [Bacillota bacterium]|nr:hypothetical protein [Bacillota bacterium]
MSIPSSGVTDAEQAISALSAVQCPATAHETVCVQADVTISPDVVVGEVSSSCVNGPAIGGCLGYLQDSCTFSVSQHICVQIPLTFSAEATAMPKGIVCGTPKTGVCQGPGCTYTIGYYQTHMDLTGALLTLAGGSITLGIDSQGTSFIVNSGNIDLVFNRTVTSPPAPASNPYKAEYASLYEQLLAANLNVLNGATCDYISGVIENANQFLADSPSGVGMEGAPFYTTELTAYNEGNGPGCPSHC